MPYYLCDYIGTGAFLDPYRPAGIDGTGLTWHSIDLRNRQALTEGVRRALVYTPSAISSPLLTKVADDAAETVTNPTRNTLEARLGIRPTSPTFDAVVEELMLNPRGWPQLIPAVSGRLEVWLGPLHRVRQSLAGGINVSDSFERADNADLGANWDAGYNVATGSCQIVTQRVRDGAVGLPVAFETWNTTTFTDLRAQILIRSWNTTTTGLAGVAVRFNAPPTFTGYRGIALKNLTNKAELQRFDNGAQTDLATDTTPDWAANDILLVRMTGTSIRLERNGTTRLGPVTDGTYVSGRAGISMWEDTTIANNEIDDFIVEDLGSPTFSGGMTQTFFRVRPRRY